MNPHTKLDEDENIVVFQYPDGTILLGTQPHNKNRKVVQCWSCKNTMVCSLNYDFAKCYHCDKLNNISSLKTATPDDESKFKIISCRHCGGQLKIPRGNAGPVQVVCALCRHITHVN